MLYDFTLPTGQRIERNHEFDGSCASSGCTVNWGSGGDSRVVRQLGLDPNSPVAKCEGAINQVIKVFYRYTPAGHRASEREAIACRYVHHGVYEPPGSL